jgi:hypothetical protein
VALCTTRNVLRSVAVKQKAKQILVDLHVVSHTANAFTSTASAHYFRIYHHMKLQYSVKGTSDAQISRDRTAAMFELFSPEFKKSFSSMTSAPTSVT